jgi:hypothetical protein
MALSNHARLRRQQADRLQCGVGPDSNQPLTTLVTSFMTPLDAELARTLLNQHDIASRLEGDLLIGAALPLQGAAGVRLLVAAEQAEEAHRLIEQHERELAADRRSTDTADARVGRAYRLAFIGFMLLPPLVHVISLVNIVRVPWSALSKRGRRHYVLGLALDLVVVLSATYWLARKLL